MQLPKDFWAFSFELTNSHLLQQKLMPALHNVTFTVFVLTWIVETTFDNVSAAELPWLKGA